MDCCENLTEVIFFSSSGHVYWGGGENTGGDAGGHWVSEGYES